MNGGRFAAEVRRSGPQTSIRFQGELDDSSAPEARAAVEEALARPAETLLLDLGGLEFMDSAGIWLVVETHRRCVEAGIALRLGGDPRPAVSHALQLGGVEELIGAADGEDGSGSKERVLLRLYLSSRSATGANVAQAFRAATERLPRDAVQVEVIDVFTDPKRAQGDRVIATPTLIKVRPEPELRLIGSIGDEDAILRYLGLRHLAA